MNNTSIGPDDIKKVYDMYRLCIDLDQDTYKMQLIFATCSNFIDVVNAVVHDNGNQTCSNFMDVVNARINDIGNQTCSDIEKVKRLYDLRRRTTYNWNKICTMYKKDEDAIKKVVQLYDNFKTDIEKINQLYIEKKAEINEILNN